MTFDFDKLIASLREGGASSEEIAKKFSEALNSYAKQEEEKKKSKRDEMIERYTEILDSHFKSQALDLSDAAAIVWLSIVKDTDEGKKMTSVKELNALYDFITDDISVMLDKWKMGKKIESIFTYRGRYEDNKSKDTEAGGRGLDRKIQSDTEIIRDFLKNLFQ